MVLLVLLLVLLEASQTYSRHHHSPQYNTAVAPATSIIILAGQSNMAGRGGVINGTRWDGAVPTECQPNPSILRFSAALQWEEAKEPLHADIDRDKTNGVGPGMPFANAVLPRLPAGSAVGLVPCAIGGTAIDRWRKGTPLYEETVLRAKAAAAAAAAEGGHGVISAVLWYQGESDTVNSEDADAYKGKMEGLIGDLRADLGLPDLLVIQVAIASGEGTFVEVVREAQKSIRLPNVAFVDAKGLPLKADHLHLTTSAQVQLGNMLAAVYLQHAVLPNS